MNRRQVLLGLTAGAVGSWVAEPTLGTPQGGSPTLSSADGDGARALPDLRRLEDLADRLRSVSREEAFDVAARAKAVGATPTTVIGAAFLVGIQEIRPRSVGGKLHAVMMVESAFQLLSGSDEDDWTVALWTLDDCKASQNRDVRESGDWRLPSRPEVRFASAQQARRELALAVESWDDDQADRAVVGALDALGVDQVFELLWPLAASSYSDIGHKIIFCSQVRRALDRIGPAATEPALRSLVHGLLYIDPGAPGNGRQTEFFEAAVERAERFPSSWLEGRDEPSSSLDLARQLRTEDPDRAQALVLEALRSGLGPQTVWDGLRLAATEIFQRRPQSAARRHGPVHPITEVNAFHHGFRTVQSERSRRLMVLQAASWLPRLRHDLEGFFGPAEGPDLDQLGRGIDDPPSLEALLESPSAAAARSRLERHPEEAATYLEGLRRHLRRRANQSHQYKFLAALEEESRWIDPRWAPAFLAPALTYLPTAADPETETWRRSRRVLDA